MVIIKRLIQKLFLLLVISSTAMGAVTNKSNVHPTSKAPMPPPPVVLNIDQKTITINGKPADIYTLQQPNGFWGFSGIKGETANILVKNNTKSAVAITWHGLEIPNGQDGAPYVTRKPIAPGSEQSFELPLNQAGTFFINGYYKEQAQKLLAAPFIVYENNTRPAQEVTMMLQDYTYGDPRLVYANAHDKLLDQEADATLPAMTPVDSPEQNGGEQQPKFSELPMDAYLANQHTLSDPSIIQVTPASKVHLRVINASANSQFWLDLGNLVGTVTAVDGQAILPREGSRFTLAQGQRLDLDVTIPDATAAYPILAQAENTTRQTGMILATPNAPIPKLSEYTAQPVPALDYSAELNFKAVNSLPPRNPDRTLTANLDGNLLSYVWTINRQNWPNTTPFIVNNGERVRLIINNQSSLAHAINIHGHKFQVIEIDNQMIPRGVVRDTVLVLPKSSVTVEFDANNPGIWLLQAQVPFDIRGGIKSTINYKDFPAALYERKDTGIPPRDVVN